MCVLAAISPLPAGSSQTEQQQITPNNWNVGGYKMRTATSSNAHTQNMQQCNGLLFFDINFFCLSVISFSCSFFYHIFALLKAG